MRINSIPNYSQNNVNFSSVSGNKPCILIKKTVSNLLGREKKMKYIVDHLYELEDYTDDCYDKINHYNSMKSDIQWILDRLKEALL